jgi:hypothetical protein
MTPQEHYQTGERFAAEAEALSGSAPEAALKFAILAVAHALLAHPPSGTGSSATSGPLLPRNLKSV